MFYLKEEITNGLLALYFCLKRNHCLHLISLNFLLLAFGISTHGKECLALF